MTFNKTSDNLIVLISEYCFLPDLLSFSETSHRIRRLLLDEHQNKLYGKICSFLKLQMLKINPNTIGNNSTRKPKSSKSETINKISLQLINQWKLYINSYHDKAKSLFKSLYDDLVLKSIHHKCSEALKRGVKAVYLQGPMAHCNHRNLCLLYQTNVYSPPGFHQELLLHSICSVCSQRCLGSAWICSCCLPSSTKSNNNNNNDNIKNTNNSAANSHFVHSDYYSTSHLPQPSNHSHTTSSTNFNDEIFCSLTCAHQSTSHCRHPFRKLTCNTNYAAVKKYLCCCLSCGLAGYITLVATTKSKGITIASPSLSPSTLLSIPTNPTSAHQNRSINTTNINKTFNNSNKSKDNKNAISTYEANCKINSLNNIVKPKVNGEGLVQVEFICVCYQSHLRQRLQSEQGRRDVVNQLTERDLLLCSSNS